MNSASLPDEAGGFLQPILPITASSTVDSLILPHPRSTPLKPGSTRENNFISYVDKTLLAISRRYELRSNTTFEDQPSSDLEGEGYKDFGEVAHDLDAVTDVVWVSGSPSLQTPYFLNIALVLSSCMLSFPFFPQPTFRLLNKLDVAFSSLLRGVSVETGISLPGFENGRGRLSTTEKVRLRGLVERTRVAVVEVAGHEGKGEFAINNDETTAGSSNNSETTEGLQDIQGHVRWEMDAARVYERTLVELGLSLDFFGFNGID